MANKLPRPDSKSEHNRRLKVLEKLPLHDVEVIVGECRNIEGKFWMFGSLCSLELIEALGIFLADPSREKRKALENNGKRLERSGSISPLCGENFTGKERRSGCDSGVEGLLPLPSTPGGDDGEETGL